jgi:hypothetical protein
MGYYKNIEIATQVEEPDRLPAPVPASQHIAYGTRKQFREIYNHHRKVARAKQRKEITEISALLLASAVLGFLLGVII